MDYVFHMSDGSELMHHGILGQKWGVRRYQNEDGTLTEAGQKRYQKQMDKADKKFLNKIDKSSLHMDTYNKSKKEITEKTVDAYVNNMNQKNKKTTEQMNDEFDTILRDTMNKNLPEINSPSGKVLQFVKNSEIYGMPARGVSFGLTDKK